jgi:pyruvate formate lyase activating enzyme
MFFEERCIGCGDCASLCPHRSNGSAGAPELCEACGNCVEVCVAGARQMAGRWMSVDDVLAEVARDVVLYDESGGGVTLSGGEPLAQPQFAEALLAGCRERGIHTALDTCGMAPPDLFLRVCALARLVLFDVKIMDSALHEQHTGAGNTLILQNLRALARANRPVVVRYPLIPGVNDGQAELATLAGQLCELGLRRLDLLPYHRLGIGKYKRLGVPPPADNFARPDPARVASIAAMLGEQGLDVAIGGRT